MGLTLLLGLIAAVGTYVASRSPTQEELVTSFQEAQRFYAEGAYDQALATYSDVAVVSSRLLDVSRVDVQVGDQHYPLLEAATYQIGNAHTKLYEDNAHFAETARDPARRVAHRLAADSAFARAIASFQRVIDTARNEQLRVQAYGRLIDLYFSAERYEDVIVAARRMIAARPDDPQIVEAYYNTGWAYYKTKRYDRAIEAFQSLLSRFDTGYRVDRSLFQIGECYREQGRYEQAIDSYRALVARQRIQELTEDELQQMRREKLAGLVDETALELAAKAEIRAGTSLVALGRYEEGLEAYRRVIALFSSERQLVEEAYLRMADLYQARGDLEAAIQTYRDAIDESTDRTLRARIQYALAERMFSEESYGAAIQEYRMYLQGYGDIADQAGFGPGRVRYRIGSSYQQLGQASLNSGDRVVGDGYLEMAIAEYDTLCALPTSPYYADARFNRALALQSMASEASLRRAQLEYEQILGEDRNGGYSQRSLVQLGELLYTRGRYEAAIERSRQLLLTYGDSDYADEAHMRIALSLQAMGKLRQASAAFLEVGAESPYYGRSRMGAGHALLSQRRYAEAVKVLEAGLEHVDDPVQLGSYRYLLGQAHRGQGNYRQAIASFTAALQLPIADELVQAVRLNRGSAALACDDFELGEEDMLWVIDHVSDAEHVRYAEDALAFSYLERDRGGDAIQILDRMIKEAPAEEERAALLSRLLDLYYSQENWTEAIRVARRLLAMRYDDQQVATGDVGTRERAYFILGDALMRTDRGDEAVATFREALQRHPDSPFAMDMQLALGAYHFSEGELERAKADFLEMSAAQLTAEQARLVSFYLANTHYSLREFEESRRIFQQLLDRHSEARELPDILFGLAESLYQLGEFESAIGHYRRLVEEYPAETAADDSQYNMAWCLMELGREEEAMAAFRQLLERYPRSNYAASAQFTLGDAAYNRGAYREAAAAYQLVLERYPDSEAAAEVPALLVELNEALAYEDYEQGIALMDTADATEQAEYYSRAIAVFKAVIEHYPGTESEVGALSNMGVCLEELGRWQQAVDTYDRVIGMIDEERATREALQFARSHRDWIVSARL